MKLIKSIQLNTGDIPKEGAVRSFTIKGDEGAKFIFIVSNSSGSYYDFTDKAFSAGHSPQKMIKGELLGGSYDGEIEFPDAAGSLYDILLIADPTDGTAMKLGKAINKRITQLGNTTLTLALASTANSSSYKTFPSNVTVVGSPTSSASKSISWNVENADTDANGFGLILDYDEPTTNLIIQDKAWYFSNTQTVDGAVSSSTEIKLDSVSDIIVGMSVYSGTGLSGTPIIRSVDTTTNTITISSAQTISDGVTLTFRASGMSLINSALGCSIAADLRLTDLVRVSSTVRGTISNSTTINLNGTYGIPGGNIAGYSGTNVNNSSANAVTSVSASSSTGSMVVQLAQTFKGGEVLTFDVDPPKVLADSIVLSGGITVNSQPNANRTIYLDLDFIITPGTAS
tara:strand:+ start:1633 stop:2829 length:1197 start_codon:yes stop_codon:yes gene_type:complete